MYNRFRRLAMAVSISALVGAPLAGAFELEEVVVTATKRGATGLQDVALSVSALGEETLNNMGVTEFSDYVRFVPGLNMQDQGPGDKKYLMRGVGSSAASAVGIYLDETVLTANNPEDGGGRNADVRLYDMERVEVLRGPQGTLYGASSFGGTIKMITNKPDLETISGSIKGEYSVTEHGGGNYKVNGVLNLPIIADTLGIRAVLWEEDAEGFIDNTRINEENFNDEETRGGRFILGWQPTDDIRVNATWLTQKTDVGGRQRYYHDNPDRDTLFGTSIFAPGSDFEGDLTSGDFNLDPYTDEMDIFSLSYEQSFESGTLTAASSFFDRDILYTFDGALLRFFGIEEPGVTTEPQNRSIFSNEIRFSSDFDGNVNFVVGGLYTEEDRSFDVDVCQTEINQPGVLVRDCSPGADSNAMAFGGDGASFFHRELDGETEQFAVFGEVSIVLTDQVTLELGARYFDFSITEQRLTTHNFGDASVSTFPDQSASESKSTFKVALSYDFDENVKLYGLVSEGFRPGGLNPANISILGTTTEIPEFYGSDEIVNYEIGLKGEFLDGRMMFNLVAFHIDWNDIQSREFDLSPFIVNAGEAAVDGFELEVQVAISDGLVASTSIGYVDAALTETPTVGSEGATFEDAGIEGDTFPSVPEWNGSVSLQYDFYVGENEAFVRVDWAYTGESATQFNPNHQFYEELDGYSLTNFNAGVTFEGFTWRLFVENLTDERAEINKAFFEQETPSTFVNRPRTIGSSIEYTF